MTELSTDQLEAIQAVVDRVSSYQESAPFKTIEKELTKALSEAGIELDGDDVGTLAGAMEAEKGSVDATELLA